jgi:amyloid beta precursor protein binding protein 1
MKAVNTALTPTSIPWQVQEILNDKKVSDPENSQFWIMCAALKAFIKDNTGLLPVRGVLPDMTAESAKYIGLQNVYRDKAKRDAEDVYNRCQAIMEESGNSPITLKPEDVRLFCKESCNLKLIRGQPIFEELETCPTSIVSEIAQNQESPNPDCMFYVMMRAALRYYSEFNFYPGASDPEQDITEFKTCVSRLLAEWNCNVNGNADYIQEFCRYGGSEIPSVAAFVGGCVAQEAIKIITGQYTPLNNTLIYNAVDCSTTSFNLPKD